MSLEGLPQFLSYKYDIPQNAFSRFKPHLDIVLMLLRLKMQFSFLLCIHKRPITVVTIVPSLWHVTSTIKLSNLTVTDRYGDNTIRNQLEFSELRCQKETRIGCQKYARILSSWTQSIIVELWSWSIAHLYFLVRLTSVEKFLFEVIVITVDGTRRVSLRRDESHCKCLSKQYSSIFSLLL